jgi:uncharacterized membrane protein YvlD (DUF360 family)
LSSIIFFGVKAFLIENHVLFYIAAATTMIAGILHLMMIGPLLKPLNFPMELLPYTDGLFLISGIAQIFWAIPMALNWNTRWFYAGLIGTIALTSLIALTRIPNEITGIALQDNNPMALFTEVMQATFILTTLTIILNKKRAIFRLVTHKTM